MTSTLYLSLSTFFFIFLSLYVVNGRKHFKIVIGHEDNIQMLRRIRAHSNFAEYTLFFLLLLIVSENQGLSPVAVHFFGVVFLLSRISHAYGLIKAEHIKDGKIHGLRFRFWGMIATFFTLLCLAIYLLVRYMELWLTV